MKSSQFEVDDYIAKYSNKNLSYDDLRSYSTYEDLFVPTLDRVGKLSYKKSMTKA